MLMAILNECVPFFKFLLEATEEAIATVLSPSTNLLAILANLSEKTPEIVISFISRYLVPMLAKLQNKASLDSANVFLNFLKSQFVAHADREFTRKLARPDTVKLRVGCRLEMDATDLLMSPDDQQNADHVRSFLKLNRAAIN